MKTQKEPILKIHMSVAYMANTRFMWFTNAIFQVTYHNPTKTVYTRFSAN